MRQQERVRQAVHKMLARTGVVVTRPPRPLVDQPNARLEVGLDHLVALLMLDAREVFFVQVGAFDGKTGDQIYDYVRRFGWRGVLIEPQRRHFERLVQNYEGCDGLRFVNAAISERREQRTLWSLREDTNDPGYLSYAPQVATFDRASLEAHRGLEDQIEGQVVDCIPLSEALEAVDQVDVLQVDVEGYDAEIIRMFDFDRFTPRIVRFENAALSRADHAAAVARLVRYGYRVSPGHWDTLAWHT